MSYYPPCPAEADLPFFIETVVRHLEEDPDYLDGPECPFSIDGRSMDSEANFIELPELSLALDNAEGQVLIVGCSHSTVEAIVREAKDYSGKNIELVMGGYHLIPYKSEDLLGMAQRLKEELGVKRVAPAHCTGHLAFKILSETYESDFIPAGLGSVIDF